MINIALDTSCGLSKPITWIQAADMTVLCRVTVVLSLMNSKFIEILTCFFSTSEKAH